MVKMMMVTNQQVAGIVENGNIVLSVLQILLLVSETHCQIHEDICYVRSRLFHGD